MSYPTAAAIAQLEAPPDCVSVLIPGRMPVGGVAKFGTDREFLLKFYALNQSNEFTIMCFTTPMEADVVAKLRGYQNSKFYIGVIRYDDLHTMAKRIKAHAYLQAIQICSPRTDAEGLLYNSDHRMYWIDTKEKLSDVFAGA